jgi:hypothetical protein
VEFPAVIPADASKGSIALGKTVSERAEDDYVGRFVGFAVLATHASVDTVLGSYCFVLATMQAVDVTGRVTSKFFRCQLANLSNLKSYRLELLQLAIQR